MSRIHELRRREGGGRGGTEWPALAAGGRLVRLRGSRTSSRQSQPGHGVRVEERRGGEGGRRGEERRGGVGGRHKSRRGALGRLQHCWQLGARCRSPSRVSLRVSHQPIQVSLPVPAALRHPPSSCARLAVESPLAPDAGSRCGIRDARRLPAESELAGGGVGGLSASVHRAAAGARPFAWRQRPWGGKGGGNPSDARESVFRT